MNQFQIIPADNFIWNYDELLKFLIKNQSKSIVLDTKGLGCCLETIGLYKLLDNFEFKSVTINHCNLIESHNRYKINILPQSYKYLEIEHSNYSHLHYWNKVKTFGVFFNRALWHRIGLAAELYGKNALINFRADPTNEDARQLFELQTLFKLCPQSAKKFFEVMHNFPCQLEDTDGYTIIASTTQHTDQLCSFYPNILIDIVAETYVSGRSCYVTEKTVRPILLKKPFIIMGSKNFMIYIRQMGFRTFYEYWDEDYDGYEGKEKYLKILKIIQTINNKSSAELASMYASMQDILDHNYNLLITQSYNKKIVYVD